MPIQPIIYTNKPNNFAFQGHSRNLQLAIDNVLRTGNITEKEKTVLIDKIKKALPTILVPEKFLGLGTHKSVYSITRKYAARVTNKQIDINNLGGSLNIGQGVFHMLRYYFGEPILELGELQILKNLGKHLPAGIPEHKVSRLNDAEQRKYYIKKYLPMFAQLSQGAYDNLAIDMERLNQIQLGAHQHCIFDSFNPNNIITKNGHLFLVDEINTLYDKPYGNTTAKLFEVLLNRMHRSKDSPITTECIKFYRKIFTKIILAVEKTEIIHAETKSDYLNWEKALERCNIAEPAYKVIECLERIHSEYSDISKRKIAVQNYLNSLYVKNSSK